MHLAGGSRNSFLLSPVRRKILVNFSKLTKIYQVYDVLQPPTSEVSTTNILGSGGFKSHVCSINVDRSLTLNALHIFERTLFPCFTKSQPRATPLTCFLHNDTQVADEITRAGSKIYPAPEPRQTVHQWEIRSDLRRFV
jgi:hypothetical protein